MEYREVKRKQIFTFIYTYFIDGKEDAINAFITSRPEFILISTEPKGYRYDGHLPTKEAKEAIGDQFIVDYVRVFDEVKYFVVDCFRTNWVFVKVYTDEGVDGVGEATLEYKEL